MKKMFLIIALVVAGLTANAQEVPNKVSSSLSDKYPDAKDVDWDRTGAMYKAAFSVGKRDYKVTFDNKGNWVSTAVKDIPANELPKKIQEGIDNSEFKNWEVGKFETAETTQETTYKVGVRKGIKMHELYFDEEGNLLRDKGKM